LILGDHGRFDVVAHEVASTDPGLGGSDTIAGGADDDVIFGQLGDDILHGDGVLVNGVVATLAGTITGADVGGDDRLRCLFRGPVATPVRSQVI